MCQSDEDECVPRPSIIGTERLATIATLLDIPVERFFEKAEARAGIDGEHSPRSEQEQLFALYLSLDPLNRSVALTMMRRLAATLPEL